jgi:uncharacterized protein
MRILVVSDTHGSPELLLSAVQHAGKTDMLLFLGDGLRDVAALEGSYEGEVWKVRGNCDYMPYDYYEHFLPLNGASIFMAHGHLYDVKTTLNRMLAKGRELKADVLCFGHTHVPILDKRGNITLLNPGSLRNTKTYGLIELKDGKAEIALRSLVR